MICTPIFLRKASFYFKFISFYFRLAHQLKVLVFDIDDIKKYCELSALDCHVYKTQFVGKNFVAPTLFFGICKFYRNVL